MEFSRQEYWSGLPFSAPGDLPNQGIKPKLLKSSALADRFFTTGPPGKPYILGTGKRKKETIKSVENILRNNE